LDTVEVVMAIEEEFSIEIPDKDADALHSGKWLLAAFVAKIPNTKTFVLTLKSL
jgi:NADH dehydrogenase (ubiquinone) 1 alpha/beta subcomplex 1